MSKVSFKDFKNFFKHYGDLPHQERGIEMLYNDLPSTLLCSESGWMHRYRNPIKKVVESKWIISKEQMGEIMLCSPDNLPDELMDDFTNCCKLFGFDKVNIAYFLGQCGHESGGLRYPIEIHDGSNYEFRRDLGNVKRGDGVKYAGSGYLQCTGRFNHTRFSEYLRINHEYDPDILEIGKTHTANKYPWTISGFWWHDNGMVQYCKGSPSVDRVGSRVNGRYLPNGFEDRRAYTRRAFAQVGVNYPGN